MDCSPFSTLSNSKNPVKINRKTSYKISDFVNVWYEHFLFVHECSRTCFVFKQLSSNEKHWITRIFLQQFGLAICLNNTQIRKGENLDCMKFNIFSSKTVNFWHFPRIWHSTKILSLGRLARESARRLFFQVQAP